MTAAERIEQTKQNLLDTTNLTEPKKVPILADIIGPAFAYAGVTYEDVMDDPVKCADAYCKLFADLPVDMVPSAGLNSPAFKAYKKMGMHDYYLGDDRTAVQHHQANSSVEGPEIYERLIRDGKYQTEIGYLPFKRFPALANGREDAKKAFIDACLEYRTSFTTNILIKEKMDELGIYGFQDESEYLFSPPFDIVFDRYRGIRNALLDLRKRPDLLRQACAKMWEEDKMMFPQAPIGEMSPLPVACIIMHPECFMSPKQFDEFFWTPFMETMYPMLEAGLKVFVLGEGSLKHAAERFAEAPKGSVLFQVDADDPIEIKKLLKGRQSVVGGIRSELLQVGTKQECIDEVKRSFDELAPGGGFIFTHNREAIALNDFKFENLFAAFETADKLSRGENL